MLEIRGVLGKNSAVIKHMRKRIEPAQAAFSDRLVCVLSSRLRVVFKPALNDGELRNKLASGQLGAQMRELV